MVNKKKEKVPDLKKQTHIPITKGEKLLALNSKDEDEFYHKYIEVYPNTGRGITAIIAIFKNRSRYKDVLPKEIPKEINIPLSPGVNEPDQLTLMIDLKNLLAELIYYEKESLKLQQEKFEYVNNPRLKSWACTSIS